MTINLTSVQEAAFNAAGEAMHDLGGYISLTRSDKFLAEGESTFTVSGSGKGTREFFAGVADTAGEALRVFIDKVNEEIVNPTPQPLRTAKDVKEAAAKIVDEAREDAALNGARKVKLDELADRIAALPVEG